MKLVKKTFLIFGIIIYFFISCNSNGRTGSYGEDELLIGSISGILNRYHFVSKNINQKYFNEILNQYFEILDNEKIFFTKSNYDEIKALNNLASEDNFGEILRISEVVENIFNVRGEQLRVTLVNYLQEPMNYDEDEYYDTSTKNRVWVATEEDLLKRWKLRLKNSVETELVAKLEENDKIKIGDAKFKEIEKEARENVTKAVKKIFNELISKKPRDYFNAYLNAMTQIYDRYTTYFPPVDQETFTSGLTGKLEGIGAQINKSDDGSIEIVSLIPGGPSFKQKKLSPGDKILKVGQDDGGEMVDVANLTMNEGLSMIRGKKGTKVRLYVRKISGAEEEISIVRDVIVLQETYARSSVFESGDSLYGYLYLPSFYRDFRNGVARNSSSDVSAELEKFNDLNVKGLVFDLRNNGGGALEDAVKISGFFIENGPIVRVRSSEREHAPLYDRDDSVLFDKPVVVLINENSASASEIVAATLQDYDRVIVMGSEQSFGKGTVQTSFDLNQINALKRFDRDFGGIKLTVQKFYRITGKSTQNIGVKPDIVFPSLSEALEPIESDFPYDDLLAIEFVKWPKSDEEKSLYKDVIDTTTREIAENPYFDEISKKVKLIKKNREKTKVSLNLRKRLQEREEFINKMNQLKVKIEKPFQDFVVQVDRKKADIYGDGWYEDLAKDIYVNTAMKVLSKVTSN